MNGTCQLKWLVSITLNSYYLKVQREIEACRLSSQFWWQRKWIKLLHTCFHNPIPTVCCVTFHFYWEPPSPPPGAPYSDILRNSPFLYFILLISTQVSREVICIFLYIFTPWLFTGRKISFSSVNHSDLKLRLAPITWFAIWLAPIVYACPLWLAGWSSRLYKWHLFYAFSSWREKECRWNLLPNIRMFRWAIQ